jgi:ubiquinone/menaquinone biosynthesis C-methylase UbiE
MNFDRIAPFYNAMETWFAGRCLQRSRLAFVEKLPVPAHALLVGEGHGRFLVPFRRKFPQTEITVIDGSMKMLEIAKERLGKEGVGTNGITFVHAMISDWRPPERKFDLIVTNFMLDCLTAEEFGGAVRKLASAATHDAHWLIADFQVPEQGMPRWRSRIILSLLYRFFGIVAGLEAKALVCPEAALGEAGFALVMRKTWDWDLLKSEWWQRR